MAIIIYDRHPVKLDDPEVQIVRLHKRIVVKSFEPLRPKKN